MYQTSVSLQQFFKKCFKIKVQKMNSLGTHKYPSLFDQDTKSDVIPFGGGRSEETAIENDLKLKCS